MAFRFVFEIKVRPGEDETFIEHWREGSKPIQEYPGAKGTRLHKKLGETSTYIAIAEWESKDARKAAMDEIHEGVTERAKRVHEWGNNEDFGEVTIIGELDEIDSALPPSQPEPQS
ncbi:MAG: antibiotic biosynthesis monooxygenase family protein [Candidatus Saccharimonadales bacterium]